MVYKSKIITSDNDEVLEKVLNEFFENNPNISIEKIKFKTSHINYPNSQVAHSVFVLYKEL